MEHRINHAGVRVAGVFGYLFIACAPSPSGTVWPTPPSTPTECAAPCDRDQDGILDPDDNCPDVANPQQTDRDHDDRGDLCDAQANIPNYKFSKSSVHVTPKMTDGRLMLQTQTKDTPHESNDGHYRMQIGSGL
jgi:hypothetical protein